MGEKATERERKKFYHFHAKWCKNFFNRLDSSFFPPTKHTPSTPYPTKPTQLTFNHVTSKSEPSCHCQQQQKIKNNKIKRNLHFHLNCQQQQHKEVKLFFKHVHLTICV